MLLYLTALLLIGLRSAFKTVSLGIPTMSPTTDTGTGTGTGPGTGDTSPRLDRGLPCETFVPRTTIYTILSKF